MENLSVNNLKSQPTPDGAKRDESHHSILSPLTEDEASASDYYPLAQPAEEALVIDDLGGEDLNVRSQQSKQPTDLLESSSKSQPSGWQNYHECSERRDQL